MESLVDRVKQRLLEANHMSTQDLERLIFATPETALHDPFRYTGMDTLVDALWAFKGQQDKDPSKLLILDTDYDTDGIMSAVVLTAALSCFNINHRIYIPTMANGYGLSPAAVEEMRQQFDDVSLILTADNGANAVEGVNAAHQHHIPVLVTDHHLGGESLAPAEVIVNPNVQGDQYPFKGNAGATVAWKAMLAYASKYCPEKRPLIDRLIVFAGIANVADVMPIQDENHFMVKEALKVIQRMQEGRPLPPVGIAGYDRVFQGLYDLVTAMQSLRDQERKAQGKRPSPLPHDEQFIGWYLAPLLNAPRRVVGTPEAAFKGLLHADPQVRHQMIRQLMRDNRTKTTLRDEALAHLDPADLRPTSNVVLIHAPSGIAGLVAGQLAGQTKRPSLVFSTLSEVEDPEAIISGSARSNEWAPLPLIIDNIQRDHPGMIVGGGGHAYAAGYAIRQGDLSAFREAFEQSAQQVTAQILAEWKDQQKDQPPQAQNRITLAFGPGQDTLESLHVDLLQPHLKTDCEQLLQFFNSLKPFGKGFTVVPQLVVLLDPSFLAECPTLNLNFWKTFKFTLQGVEFLTFNQELAKQLKIQLAEGNMGIIPCQGELKMNTFRGMTTPQVVLSPLS